MFYRVTEVCPLPDLTLSVLFADGARKRYDLKPLISRFEAFAALQSTKGLFECVQVDAGGYGISWNDDIDLSGNELYENGMDP